MEAREERECSWYSKVVNKTLIYTVNIYIMLLKHVQRMKILHVSLLVSLSLFSLSLFVYLFLSFHFSLFLLLFWIFSFRFTISFFLSLSSSIISSILTHLYSILQYTMKPLIFYSITNCLSFLQSRKPVSWLLSQGIIQLLARFI